MFKIDQIHKRCVCEILNPPPPHHFFKCDWYLTLTLVGDLDLDTRKRGLTTRNTLEKYESSISNHSKIMANVKDFYRSNIKLMKEMGRGSIKIHQNILLGTYLTHYQTTNFRLFKTKEVCRWQFKIWRKWQKVIQTGRKHCGKQEKLLVTSNFSFSHSVFKRLVSQGRQKVLLSRNGLNLKKT